MLRIFSRDTGISFGNYRLIVLIKQLAAPCWDPGAAQLNQV